MAFRVTFAGKKANKHFQTALSFVMVHPAPFRWKEKKRNGNEKISVRLLNVITFSETPHFFSSLLNKSCLKPSPLRLVWVQSNREVWASHPSLDHIKPQLLIASESLQWISNDHPSILLYYKDRATVWTNEYLTDLLVSFLDTARDTVIHNNGNFHRIQVCLLYTLVHLQHWTK